MTSTATTDPARVAAHLARSRRVLLVAHRPPDADGVGSMLALARLLEAMGKEVARVCVEPLDDALATLPGADRVVAQPPPGRFDAAVLLDCASLSRSGLDAAALARVDSVVNIDHHVTNPGFGDLPLVVPDAPSTTAVVTRLFAALGAELTADDATALYAGLITDTERFTAIAAGADAHRLAARLIDAGAATGRVVEAFYADRSVAGARLLGVALTRLRTGADGRVAWIELDRDDFARLGLDPIDTEDFAPVALALRGVWAAAYLRPGRDGIRVGLRSRHAGVDVATVAAGFGGGGHRWSAGCVLPPAPGAAARVATALEEAVRRVGD
jgi:phosphoesterase RecJ-like protein